MIRAVARIDLDAVEHNARRLAGLLTDGSSLCAVVKADGYGHGAVPCARAALRGGATTLAVATAEEAKHLREGLDESPRILVLGARTREETLIALAAGAEIAVWREASREEIAQLAAEQGMVPRLHVKYDTGMGRLGARDPDAVLRLAGAVASDERTELAAVWTHFATADADDPAFLERQLDAFNQVVGQIRSEHPGVGFHAANSATALREPAAHFDMVRCGVALYGLDPFGKDPRDHYLRPAMELASYVADVKRFQPGDSAGYGRSWSAERETWVAPLPIGYGDGFRRGLSNASEALIGGERYPVVGTVSMDNVTVDLGPETSARAFDEAIVIGERGGQRILAEDLARALGTINYEVVSGISGRVPREYSGGEAP